MEKRLSSCEVPNDDLQGKIMHNAGFSAHHICTGSLTRRLSLVEISLQKIIISFVLLQFLFLTNNFISFSEAQNFAGKGSQKNAKVERKGHERIRDSAKTLEQSLEKGEDETKALNNVVADIEAVESEDEENSRRFQEIEEKLKSLGASQALVRHQKVVEEYKRKRVEFKTVAEELKKTKNKKTGKDRLKSKARDLINVIEKNKPKEEYHIRSAANRLPWRLVEPGDIKLLGDSSSMPAPLAVVTSTTAPATDDLSPTIDVQITPEIQELARSLDNNPLKIFRHVYNNYRFTPYYGSMKGSLDTYWEQEGNDYDLASLLIALLRASNVPARYAKSKVLVPIEKIKKWVDINDSWAALQYLSSGKMPIGGYYAQGGAISHVLMERVYVEAYVPYSNYRGTGEDASGKIWIPMDPSMKENTILQDGTDIAAGMGLQWKQFTDEYLSTLKNVTPMGYYREKVNDYLSLNYPGESLDTLRRKTEIRAMQFDFLPNTLPYSVLEVIGRFSEIPQEQRHTLKFRLFSNFDYPTTLPEVAGRRITLTFAAATPDDQAVIDKFGGIFKTPPYAINLKPQLRINGEVKAEGAALGGGSRRGFEVEYTQPGGKTDIFDHTVTIGSSNAVGITVGKVRPEMATIATVEESAEPYLPKMLHSFAMIYHDRANQSRQLLNDTMKLQSRVFITEGLVSTRHNVRTWWGIPISFDLVGYMIDAKELATGAVPVDGGSSQKVIDYMMLGGYEASYQENATFEDSLFWVSGLSAVKAFAVLNAMNIPIIEYAPPQTYFNPGVDDVIANDINDALNKGWKVMVPLSDGGLPVFPYIMYDEKTGSAGYMIASAAGGFNGFMEASSELLDAMSFTLSWSGPKQLSGIDFQAISPETGLTVALGNVFFLHVKMILHWSDGTVEEKAFDDYGTPWGMWIPTGPWVYVSSGLPLPWWNPGHYRITYSGNPIFEFYAWGASIDSAALNKYMEITTENGVDAVQNPLTISYNISQVPNINLSSVNVKILTAADNTSLRTIVLPNSTGSHSTVWNGMKDNGQIAAPGEYLIRIEATGTGGTVQGMPEPRVLVLKADLDGFNAGTGTEVTDATELSAGVVAQDESILPYAKVVAYNTGLDGYEREIIWSGSTDKILVSETEGGDYMPPQNVTLTNNVPKILFVKTAPEFTLADTVMIRMNIKKSGSSEIIFNDAVTLGRVPIDIKAKFRIIENETLMTAVEDAGEIFYRTLGGMRVHLEATGQGSNPITEYEWSASSGKFFGSYAQGATELTGDDLKGAALNQTYWQGDYTSGQNITISLKLKHSDGSTIVKTQKIKSRILKFEDKGDDVKMLQAFLRMIGISQGSTPGVQGTAVVANGDFGAGVVKAVKRLQARDMITSDGIVGPGTLSKIRLHWNDYLAAYEAYSDSARINKNHQDFSAWISVAANELKNTYTDAIQQSVDPNTTREKLLIAWINKETGIFGHWGHSINFRVTLGSADEHGSIGFSQILNRHKYGSYSIEGIQNLNIYNPLEGVKGFAVFSNDLSFYDYGGAGFNKAFVSPQPYKHTESYPTGTYPRLGNAYTDNNKDLLSKAIMAYNRGSKLEAFRTKAWPEILKTNGPNDTITIISATTQEPEVVPTANARAIRYSLEVQNSAGVPLKTWTWTDIKNNVEFSFTYSETEWLSGKSWQQKRNESTP